GRPRRQDLGGRRGRRQEVVEAGQDLVARLGDLGGEGRLGGGAGRGRRVLFEEDYRHGRPRAVAVVEAAVAAHAAALPDPLAPLKAVLQADGGGRWFLRVGGTGQVSSGVIVSAIIARGALPL